MKYIRKGMSLSLVPDKISVYFEITNCALRCKGCHTPELRENIGTTLTREGLAKALQRYRGYAEVVVFLGSGANAQDMRELLVVCKVEGFMTCLYTGAPNVCDSIKEGLDYIKTGPYVAKLGGLESETTNQTFTRLSDGKVLNNNFRR